MTTQIVTPAQRVAALHEAKNLLVGEPQTHLFGKGDTPAPSATALMRLATFINTGVDYRDRAEVDVLHSTRGTDRTEVTDKDDAGDKSDPEARTKTRRGGTSTNIPKLIGGNTHPEDTEFITPPAEGDTYDQYDKPNVVKLATWEFRDGAWVLRETYTEALRQTEALREARDGE